LGKYDSSLTRVQPIFKALYNKDALGKSWVSKLLKLGSRTGQSDIPDIIQLAHQPIFELSADPPKEFLKWLVSNPDRLTNPNYKCSPKTMRKRELLMAGDKTTFSEAIRTIDNCNKIPVQAWWRLEGVTKVDCALRGDNSVIFIEGKRTEMGASKNIAWYSHRNQVLRNLDCVAEYARQHQLTNFYVMLVVEKRLTESDPLRQAEINQVTNPDIIKDSLPHLTVDQRQELIKHYLGVTTWEDIVAEFDLDSGILIDK
jgi:hypothetical protein